MVQRKRNMNKRCIGILGILFFGAALAGCVPQATVKAAAPATGPLPGGHKIALGLINGPAGETVARALEKELAFVLTDPKKAEALLHGRATYEISEKKGVDLVSDVHPTGRTETVEYDDPFIEEKYNVQRPETKQAVREQPYVHQTGRLDFTFKLVGPDNSVLARPGRISSKSERKYGGLNEQSPHGRSLASLMTREQLVAKMSEEVAFRLVKRLAPWIQAETFVLDIGEGYQGEAVVVEGVKAARKGQWDLAESAWKRVLEKNPDHPSALYNLGVARERLGDRKNLERAEEYYGLAIKAGNNPIYMEALVRTAAKLRVMERDE
jgi:tetratricopeptide (TPR) repeat protein